VTTHKNIYNRPSARRSVLHTALFRVVSQVATVLGFIVLVRGMTEHDFGVFQLLYSIIPIISTAASLGLTQVLKRYEPEYLSQGLPGQAAWLVRILGRTRFGVNLVILTAIFLSWHVVMPTFQLEPYRAEYVLFSVLILFFFQIEVLNLSLSSHMLHKYAVGLLAVMSILKLAGYAAYIWIDDLSLSNAILVDTLAHGVVYASLYVVHRRYCRPPPEKPLAAPSKSEKKRLLRYGFFNNFNDVGTLALDTRVDNFFIAAFLDPVSAGTYAFYTRLSQMAHGLLPIKMFIGVVQPLFFAIPNAQSLQKLPLYFTFLLNTSLLFQLPMTAFVTMYHAEIIELVFAGRFSDYSALLPLAFLFVTFNILGTPATLVAQYAERAAIILASKIFAIYNIAALLVLVPIAGVYGAMLATGTATVLKNLFIWWHVRKVARWLEYRRVLSAGAICWGGFIAASALVKQNVDAPAAVQLVIGSGMLLATCALYVRTPALSQHDRQLIRGTFSGAEGRLLRMLGM
jgi:O-antigen/teichoic acid export membrane protein